MNIHPYYANQGKICLKRWLQRISVSFWQGTIVHHRFIPYSLIRMRKNPALMTERCSFVIITIPSRQNYNDKTNGTPVRSFAGTLTVVPERSFRRVLGL